MRNFDLSSRYFACLGHISLLSTTFGDGFFQFQDNKVSLKQDPGHNHETRYFIRDTVPLTMNNVVVMAIIG